MNRPIHEDNSVQLWRDVTTARTLAERKAWDALSRYKFYMFGYHAASWVKYNQLLPQGARDSNPFGELILAARNKLAAPATEPKETELA